MNDLGIPFLPGAQLLSFVLASPIQGTCMVFAFIGCMGAFAYFPHIALSDGPRKRRLWAALAEAAGLIWIAISYIVASTTESNVEFIYTQSFASFAPFGVLTIVLERKFGHPLFKSEHDIGFRTLGRAERPGKSKNAP